MKQKKQPSTNTSIYIMRRNHMRHRGFIWKPFWEKPPNVVVIINIKIRTPTLLHQSNCEPIITARTNSL